MKKLLDKIKNLGNGYKTYAGIAVILAYVFVPQFAHIPLPDAVLHFGEFLVGVGLTHKFDKALSLARAVLDSLDKANAAINK